MKCNYLEGWSSITKQFFLFFVALLLVPAAFAHGNHGGSGFGGGFAGLINDETLEDALGLGDHGHGDEGADPHGHAGEIDDGHGHDEGFDDSHDDDFDDGHGHDDGLVDDGHGHQDEMDVDDGHGHEDEDGDSHDEVSDPHGHEEEPGHDEEEESDHVDEDDDHEGEDPHDRPMIVDEHMDDFLDDMDDEHDEEQPIERLSQQDDEDDHDDDSDEDKYQERHRLAIITPSTVDLSCDQDVTFRVAVINMGTEREENLFVSIQDSPLIRGATNQRIDLDEGSSFELSAPLSSRGLEKGSYPIVVTAFNADTLEQVFTSVEVSGCDTGQGVESAAVRVPLPPKESLAGSGSGSEGLGLLIVGNVLALGMLVLGGVYLQQHYKPVRRLFSK